MQNFIDSLQQAINQQNWNAALVLALTLPDICARLQFPLIPGSQARYIKWFDEYLLPIYTQEIGASHKTHIFLNGADYYALRCALLHEGTDSISNQSAADVLNRFHFVSPPLAGSIVHLNQFDQTLQLQVDHFGREILDAVMRWWSSVENQEDLDRLLLRVHSPESVFG